MCGIAAVFAYSAKATPVDREGLIAVCDAMAARGPDGEGLWINSDGRVGLAHRRLAIIDPSPAGAQPMEHSNGRFRITYNGEVYNFRELRADLEKEGRVFRSRSDTEVLLQLYERDGPRMVERLRGMFAFALWDEERGGMLLARDPFGIKPLYYADDGRTLRVASQVKALLKGGGIDTSPRPGGHAGFFLFGYVPEPFTLFRGIHALPAGSTLCVDRHGSQPPVRYFDVARELAQRDLLHVEDAEARLRRALVDSVHHHFVADVPVGVFLSAGLDSATVLALASETEGARLDTVTLGFDEYRGKPPDETPIAEKLAETFHTRHHTRRVAAEEFSAELEALLEAMDQPSTNGVNVYFVAKAAAEAGLKVALSGLGGDELFAGYNTFRQVPELVRLCRGLGGFPAVGLALRRLLAPIAGWLGSSKYAGLLEYGTGVAGAYLLRRALFMPWELPGLLGDDLARAGLEELDPLRRLVETADVPGRDSASMLLQVTALEMAWYMRNQLLRDADWAGMAHSVEIRTPLVDVVLFRELLPLITSRRAPGKVNVALALKQSLPAYLLTRRKTGFSVPVQRWLADIGMERGDRGLCGWARHVYRAATQPV